MDRVQGMIVPLVTPLRTTGEVDLPGLRRLCEIQIRAGIDVLFLLGTTGEFYGLTPAQRRQVVETAVESVAGKIPVIVGISGDSTASSKATLDVCRHASLSGYVCSSPYFLSYSQAELLDYFRELADAVGEPIILYNYPSRYRHLLEIETVGKLVAEKRVFAIKDTDGDLEYMYRLLELKAHFPAFRVFEGALKNLALSAQRGLDGSVQALGNLWPKECARLWSLAKEQAWQALQADIDRMWKFHVDIEEVAIFIAALKGCMALRGWCEAQPAAPTHCMSRSGMAEVRKLMDSAYEGWEQRNP